MHPLGQDGPNRGWISVPRSIALPHLVLTRVKILCVATNPLCRVQKVIGSVVSHPPENRLALGLTATCVATKLASFLGQLNPEYISESSHTPLLPRSDDSPTAQAEAFPSSSGQAKYFPLVLVRPLRSLISLHCRRDKNLRRSRKWSRGSFHGFTTKGRSRL